MRQHGGVTTLIQQIQENGVVIRRCIFGYVYLRLSTLCLRITTMHLWGLSYAEMVCRYLEVVNGYLEMLIRRHPKDH